MKLVTRALIASSAMALMLAAPSASLAQGTLPNITAPSVNIPPPPGDPDDVVIVDQDLADLQTALANKDASKAAQIIAKLDANQLNSLASNSAVKNALKNSSLAGSLANAIKTQTISNPDAAGKFVSFASAVGNTSLTKNVAKALANAAKSFQGQNGEAISTEASAKIDKIANAVASNTEMRTEYQNTYSSTGTAALTGDQTGQQGQQQEQQQQTDNEPTNATTNQVVNNAVGGQTNTGVGVQTPAGGSPTTPPPASGS